MYTLLGPKYSQWQTQQKVFHLPSQWGLWKRQRGLWEWRRNNSVETARRGGEVRAKEDRGSDDGGNATATMSWPCVMARQQQGGNKAMVGWQQRQRCLEISHDKRNREAMRECHSDGDDRARSCSSNDDESKTLWRGRWRSAWMQWRHFRLR